MITVVMGNIGTVQMGSANLMEIPPPALAIAIAGLAWSVIPATEEYVRPVMEAVQPAIAVRDPGTAPAATVAHREELCPMTECVIV